MDGIDSTKNSSFSYTPPPQKEGNIGEAILKRPPPPPQHSTLPSFVKQLPKGDKMEKFAASVFQKLGKAKDKLELGLGELTRPLQKSPLSRENQANIKSWEDTLKDPTRFTKEEFGEKLIELNSYIVRLSNELKEEMDTGKLLESYRLSDLLEDGKIKYQFWDRP